jgi:uncharacterized membrane protein YccF (DUF307 family)
MRTVLNLIWLLFSGLWLAISYALAGLVLCLLIVTNPFGLACFRLAAFVLWPFGRAVVRKPEAGPPRRWPMCCSSSWRDCGWPSPM